MPIPSSGPLSFSRIRNEFNANDPVSISQYYRGQGLVPDAPSNVLIPSSPGQTIRVSYFRGAANEIVAVITSSSPITFLEQVTVADIFGSNWTAGVPKRLIINTNIGSRFSNTPAINIDSNMGGTLEIENNGTIYGAAGPGGAGSNSLSSRGGNGGTGGTALRTRSPIGLTNNGIIGGGGGGGGGGGKGATRSCGSYPSSSYTRCGTCSGGCPANTSKSENPNGPCCTADCRPGRAQFTCTITCTGNSAGSAAGGAGSPGSSGAGYQVARGTQPGSPGGNGCGNGGTAPSGGAGGRGGNLGNTGAAGARGAGGGSPGGTGGLKGYYFDGVSRITLRLAGSLLGDQV